MHFFSEKLQASTGLSPAERETKANGRQGVKFES